MLLFLEVPHRMQLPRCLVLASLPMGTNHNFATQLCKLSRSSAPGHSLFSLIFLLLNPTNHTSEYTRSREKKTQQSRECFRSVPGFSGLFLIWFSLPPPLSFFSQSGVGNEERICILPPARGFLVQLPLTGVDDSPTYKNGMQTTAHWSKKNLMANLLAALRTWPFLAWSSYGALTYCCSPAKSKTIHAPTAVPEIDSWLKRRNVPAAWDSQSSTLTWWRSQSRSTSGSPAGHSAPGLGHPPCTALPSPGQRLQPQTRTSASRGKARIQVKPIKNSPAINSPQLSVQENQLLHHLKCSTCTYMKVLKGIFRRYAEERGGAGAAEHCPEKEPTAVFVSLPLPVFFHKQYLGEKASINVNNCSSLHDPWPICKLTQFLNYICL